MGLLYLYILLLRLIDKYFFYKSVKNTNHVCYKISVTSSRLFYNSKIKTEYKYVKQR